MKPVSSLLFKTGVMTIAIMAAVSLSTDAYAFSRHAGRGIAQPIVKVGAGSRTPQRRGTFLLNQTGDAHANAAATGGQARAGMGGWRSRLAHPQAEASGERTGGYSTLHHGDGTFTPDYTRGQGTSTRENTVTGDNGKTASWTTQQSVTHGGGTLTGSTTVTGENGKSWSRSTTANANNDTLTHTVTGADGQTHGYTLQGDGTPGDGDRSGTYTTQNGKTGTYDQKVSYSDGTVTRDNTVTNASGQSAGWTTDVSRGAENGVYSKDKTVTGDNGKTESWETSYDKNTDTLTHTYTAPNGKEYGGSATFNQ